jgi:hypothetical protein
MKGRLQGPIGPNRFPIRRPETGLGAYFKDFAVRSIDRHRIYLLYIFWPVLNCNIKSPYLQLASLQWRAPAT